MAEIDEVLCQPHPVQRTERSNVRLDVSLRRLACQRSTRRNIGDGATELGNDGCEDTVQASRSPSDLNVVQGKNADERIVKHRTTEGNTATLASGAPAFTTADRGVAAVRVDRARTRSLCSYDERSDTELNALPGAKRS